MLLRPMAQKMRWLVKNHGTHEAGHGPNQGDEPEMEDEPNETSHEARHMTPQEPAYPPPPPAIRPGPPLVWWHGGVYIERYETGSFRIYEEVDGEWVDMRLSEDDLETMRQIATRAMGMMTQASEVELLSWLQQLRQPGQEDIGQNCFDSISWDGPIRSSSWGPNGADQATDMSVSGD